MDSSMRTLDIWQHEDARYVLDIYGSMRTLDMQIYMAA
jgi:hypothetical protein